MPKNLDSFGMFIRIMYCNMTGFTSFETPENSEQSKEEDQPRYVFINVRTKMSHSSFCRVYTSAIFKLSTQWVLST